MVSKCGHWTQAPENKARSRRGAAQIAIWAEENSHCPGLPRHDSPQRLVADQKVGDLFFEDRVPVGRRNVPDLVILYAPQFDQIHPGEGEPQTGFSSPDASSRRYASGSVPSTYTKIAPSTTLAAAEE